MKTSPNGTVQQPDPDASGFSRARKSQAVVQPQDEFSPARKTPPHSPTPSPTNQMVWAAVVVAIACCSIQWGTDAWLGLVKLSWGSMGPQQLACQPGISCFYLGAFGLLSVLFYPVGLIFALVMAVELEPTMRLLGLPLLALLFSIARVTGECLVVALA